MATQGSRKRAFEQGEAQWYDTNCEVEMPFICQAFGISTPFKLTVSTELDLAGGYVVGGGMLISSNLAQVQHLLYAFSELVCLADWCIVMLFWNSLDGGKARSLGQPLTKNRQGLRHVYLLPRVTSFR